MQGRQHCHRSLTRRALAWRRRSARAKETAQRSRRIAAASRSHVPRLRAALPPSPRGRGELEPSPSGRGAGVREWRPVIRLDVCSWKLRLTFRSYPTHAGAHGARYNVGLLPRFAPPGALGNLGNLGGLGAAIRSEHGVIFFARRGAGRDAAVPRRKQRRDIGARLP